MVDAVSYRMENNGDVIELSAASPTGYLKERGARGFGIAPTNLSIKEGALGGGRWRNTRRGPRDIDLPIVFQAENRQEIEDMMRRLTRLMSDRVTPATLYGVYPDGREVSTQFHYAGGGDHQYGADTNGRTWARWPITLRCPDPYWTARDAVSYPLRAGNVGRGLIKTGGGGLSRLRLSSSQAIGTITVVNSGDVEAQPVWVVKGPGDVFTATREQDGQSFAFETAITSLETITIDTRTKLVTDQTGANRYADLGVAPKLFTIPPGESLITAQMTNATSDTLISLYFQPRQELVF